MKQRTPMISALVLLVSILSARAAFAEIEQVGPNLFVAGVLSTQFEFFAAPGQQGRQRQSNWCWAASVQMVLNYHGLFVSQEQIVQRIYGSQVDQAAQPVHILTALSGWAPDARGRYSAIYATPYTFSGSQIVQDLANRWPIIVGLQNPNGGGHALVVTAVYYSVDQWNNPIFLSVVLRDPWPGSPSRQEMPWTAFQQRLTFMARVYVLRL
jgi:hypothetical protein